MLSATDVYKIDLFRQRKLHDCSIFTTEIEMGKLDIDFILQIQAYYTITDNVSFKGQLRTL